MDDTQSLDQSDELDEAQESQQDAYRVAQTFLTPAMQAFAEHWAKNRNQIKAYQHAFPGCSHNAAKNLASRLFRDPRVLVEIRRIIDRWTDHSAIELSRLEHELSRLATADIRNVFNEAGDVRKPHEWDADTAAAVHSVKTTTTTAKNGDVTVSRTVRMYDKHAAARTLAEIKGAFEKQKAPPGVLASFTFNIGGKAIAPGQGQQALTIEMEQPSAPRRGKTSQIRALQAPRTGSANVQTRPKPAKRAPVEHAEPESATIGASPTRRLLFGDKA